MEKEMPVTNNFQNGKFRHSPVVITEKIITPSRFRGDEVNLTVSAKVTDEERDLVREAAKVKGWKPSHIVEQGTMLYVSIILNYPELLNKIIKELTDYVEKQNNSD